MGKIPNDEDTVLVREGSYRFDVEELASVELDSGEEDESRFCGVFLDYGEDEFR